MYFEEEDQLPPLIPITKRKTHQNQQDSPIQRIHQPQDNGLSIFPKKQNANVQKEVNVREKASQPMRPEMIEQFDRKFRDIHEKGEKKQQRQKNKISHKERQVEKSKYLITEIMKKIDAKNITQQLYPVTNQTIKELIRRTDEEIDFFKADAERKQSSLASNPNNQHLKKQLAVLKGNIDRCVTVKQLYNQKINLRNKITILERNILQLREQNTNLKIKISRGIETISNHMHNLPCQKQKQLNEQLSSCKTQLKSEKEMRTKLEQNISEIVLNFKRLYEEADIARLIVAEKLKEIQDKEKMMANAAQEASKQHALSQKKSPQMVTQDRRKRHHQSAAIDENSSTHKKSLQNPAFAKTPATLENKGKQKEKQATVTPFSLDEQIRKMRSNQTTLGRAYK